MDTTTPRQRAKIILDRCDKQLRSCSIGSMMELEDVITAQIKEAVYEAIQEALKGYDAMMADRHALLERLGLINLPPQATSPQQELRGEEPSEFAPNRLDIGL